MLKEHVAAALEKDKNPAPGVIADALSEAISSFDKDIGQALLDVFPDQDALAKMTDEEIQSKINDDGPISTIILHCMRGTTVLISIIGPTRSNLWVASLGDCAASKRPFKQCVSNLNCGPESCSTRWEGRVWRVEREGVELFA